MHPTRVWLKVGGRSFWSHRKACKISHLGNFSASRPFTLIILKEASQSLISANFSSISCSRSTWPRTTQSYKRALQIRIHSLCYIEAYLELLLQCSQSDKQVVSLGINVLKSISVPIDHYGVDVIFLKDFVDSFEIQRDMHEFLELSVVFRFDLFQRRSKLQFLLPERHNRHLFLIAGHLCKIDT